MHIEKNRLDCAMMAFHAISQHDTDLERVFAAMASLDGLLLTGASDEVRQAIELFGLHYNSITKRYPPDAFHSDRVSLNAADAADLVARITTTIETIRDAETERILNRLRHHGGKLPEAEIIEMRRHQEWFNPILIREFRDGIDRVKQNPSPDDRPTEDECSSVPFFAFYLFSEWNMTESIPLVLECLDLTDDSQLELIGDALHEQLPSYLAQFLSHDIGQIDAIICNPKVNEYVRWGTLTSYHYLVRDQVITADDAIVRLERNFLATKMMNADGRPSEEHSYELSAAILDMLQKLGCSMQSILSDSKTWDFVETSIFHPKHAEAFSESEVQKELDSLPPTRLSDCMECLRHWASFDPPKPKPAIKSEVKSDILAALNSIGPSRIPTPINPAPERSQVLQSSTIRKVEQTPRNAKCPCGSGKKYKQCCLRNR
jgi:hypothetical protein